MINVAINSRYNQFNNIIFTISPATNTSQSAQVISSFFVIFILASAAVAAAGNGASSFSSSHQYYKIISPMSSRPNIPSEHGPHHRGSQEITCHRRMQYHRHPSPILAFLRLTTSAKQRKPDLRYKATQSRQKGCHHLRWKCPPSTDESVTMTTSRLRLSATPPSNPESQDSEQKQQRRRQHKWQGRQNQELVSVDQEELEERLYRERFKRRLQQSSRKQLEALSSLPPHSDDPRFDDPKNVITSVLEALRTPHIPCPFFGYEVLYGCCTGGWRGVLRRSVGVDSVVEKEEEEDGRSGEKRPYRAERNEEDREIILRALSSSMERDNNQFGILVGLGTDHDHEPTTSQQRNVQDGSQYDVGDTYVMEFPWDTLDYYDGTAWLECRLRHAQTDQLLVVLGFSLTRREGDGKWLIDGMDWQDFRERYRPGIGREEWERICG